MTTPRRHEGPQDPSGDPGRLIRQGMWVYVFFGSLSIAADIAERRPEAIAIGLRRAIGVAVALLGALALRRMQRVDQVRDILLLVVAVIVGASLLQDHVTRDPYSTLLLTATMTLVIATIMPWTWRGQLLLAAIGCLGNLGNWSIVQGPLFLAINSMLVCLASVPVALALQRERSALAESKARASESEARLRQIADNAREVFWTLEVHGDQLADLSYVSPASETLLGIPPETPVSMSSLFERIHPDERGRLEKLFQLAIHVRAPGAVEFRVITPAGETRHMQARFTPIRDESGTMVRIGGVLEDVTTERQAAAAMQRARDEAQTTARSRSHFLAAMSHEISTPLAAILGTLDLLKESAAPPLLHGIETLHTEAQSLHLLLSDVLDFSKSEAGELRLRLDELNLPELVEGIVELHAARARSRGLDLRSEWRGPPHASGVGDAGRLRQVLNNLVSNAIKFTPRGQVRVRAMALDDEQRSVQFEVADTGIGVPAEQSQRIFEPFAQADETIPGRYGGTGLGLAIAARLVERMGGKIGVESDAHGSRFSFTVPLGWVERDPQSRVLLDRDRPAEILVVDDSEVVREIMAEMVRRIGHHPQIAGTGAQALDALEHKSFDLVLLDCQMPEMDGFETAGRIRAVERGKRTPIIAVSAGDPELYREQCLGAGMDDCLSKPVDPAALADVVARWLRRRSSILTQADETDLDRDRLADLGGHRPETVERLSDLFVREARQVIDEMTRIIEGGDAQSLAAAVHRVRGAAAYVGALSFEKILERASSAEPSPVEFGGLIDDLSHALERFEQSVAALERDLHR